MREMLFADVMCASINSRFWSGVYSGLSCWILNRVIAVVLGGTIRGQRATQEHDSPYQFITSVIVRSETRKFGCGMLVGVGVPRTNHREG